MNGKGMAASSGIGTSLGEPVVFTIEEVAHKLGISRNGAYEAAKRGEIPTLKIGRLLRVPRIPFERMLAGD